MRFFFDKHPVSQINDLIALYKPGEFESPTRSTVPLFSLLQHGGAVWGEIAGEFAAEGGAGEMHLEFTVEPPQGTGQPSHTDVMLINANRAFALEAKWTEPRYDTVGEWLGKGTNPDNRRMVMCGWLSLLRPCTRPLHVEAFTDAVYQMVHRAASACVAGRAPAMAYIQFSPLPDATPPDIARLKCDLAHLHHLLGDPTGFPFHLIEVEVSPTATFKRIKALPKGSAETARTVRAVLGKEPLFEFTISRWHTVGPARGSPGQRKPEKVGG